MKLRQAWPEIVLRNFCGWTAGCVILLTLAISALPAQTASHERIFPQSKAEVEKTLATFQSNLAGRLPVLDGFAKAGSHPLSTYQRGYYQASVEVAPTASGGSRVRVAVKVTAWYSEGGDSHGRYELLASNGRLEEDMLDQLAEQLARISPAANAAVAGNKSTSAGSAGAESTNADSGSSNLANVGSTNSGSPKPESAAATHGSAMTMTSAPVEQSTDAGPGISAPSAVSQNSRFSAASGQSLTSAEEASANIPPNPGQPGSGQSAAAKSNSALQAEAENLEEILKNQGHPKNLVAVKKSGTAVVSTPSLSAKPLFLASVHDEFEMLDFNRDWVHVKISGLSRGWIWRNGVEMPEGIAETQTNSGPPPAADLFHVVREETAPFPGDWAPLRGKTVKILSVQMADNNPKEPSAGERLAYAKFLLDKSYGEISQKTAAQKAQDLNGIVLIFDSADGGMIAATMVTLQQWKAGTLSDAALWHNCFFDPPETFDSSAPSGSR